MGNRVISLGLIGRGEKMAVRLYLVARLRILGEITLFLLCLKGMDYIVIYIYIYKYVDKLTEAA